MVGGFSPTHLKNMQLQVKMGENLPQFSGWKFQNIFELPPPSCVPAINISGCFGGGPWNLPLTVGSCWTGCVFGTNPLQFEGKVYFGEVAIIWPAWIIALRNLCNSADVFLLVSLDKLTCNSPINSLKPKNTQLIKTYELTMSFMSWIHVHHLLGGSSQLVS